MNFYTREEKQSRRVVNAGCQATAVGSLTEGSKASGTDIHRLPRPHGLSPSGSKPRHTGAPEEGPEFPKKPSVCVGGSVG